MREILHQSIPPIARIAAPQKRPKSIPLDEFVSGPGAVSVGDGVTDGARDAVAVGGSGVWEAVAVAGGVTSRSNFCSGRMMEVLLNPFHLIKSESGISYKPAIHKSVSPLWTV